MELNEKLGVLEEKLTKLENKLQMALDEQKVCQDEADRTANALDLANRLILGLSSERVRWKEYMVKYHEQMNTTLGDTLIAACFISYLGSFTQIYRDKIIREYWFPTFNALQVCFNFFPSFHSVEYTQSERPSIGGKGLIRILLFFAI